MTDAFIYAVGATLSAVTPNAAMLLFARTLIGLAIGADSAIATAYIAEYAPANRRGSLSMLQQWLITVGILIAYLVALVILWALPGSAGGLDWRLILGLGAVPAIIGLVLRTRMPEVLAALQHVHFPVGKEELIRSAESARSPEAGHLPAMSGPGRAGPAAPRTVALPLWRGNADGG